MSINVEFEQLDRESKVNENIYKADRNFEKVKGALANARSIAEKINAEDVLFDYRSLPEIYTQMIKVRDEINNLLRSVQVNVEGTVLEEQFVKKEFVEANYVAKEGSILKTKNITQGTNLNNLGTNLGWYVCTNNPIARSLKNCPTQYSFAMLVINVGVSTTKQILHTYFDGGDKIYTRSNYNGWSDWKEVSFTNNAALLNKANVFTQSQSLGVSKHILMNLPSTDSSNAGIRWYMDGQSDIKFVFLAGSNNGSVDYIYMGTGDNYWANKIFIMDKTGNLYIKNKIYSNNKELATLEYVQQLEKRIQVLEAKTQNL